MKKSKIFYHLKTLITIILMANASGFAQTPEKLWEAFFDGALNGRDESKNVITDLSGKVYVTGTSFHTFGGGDFTTVKYSENGSLVWADHFSNTQAAYLNYGVRLAMDKWQNVYAIGTTALNDGDLAVCKFNGDGRLWARNYEPNFFGSFDDYGIDIDLDSSGNFYALARVTSTSGNLFDMYLMKCDSGGSKIWDVDYTGASDDDYPVALDVTPGGTAYTVLQSFNFFGTQTKDITTIQYLENGVQNWFSNYNGAGDAVDYPTSISVDAAENQYVCGTAFTGSNNDMVVMEQNIFGTRLWVATYSGTANLNDTAVSVTRLPNGNAVVTGNSIEIFNSILTDAIITMSIDNGTISWINKFYGTDDLGASVTDMITDASGNIYVCGFENLSGGTKNGCILKYDINGNLLWNVSYDAGLNLDDKFNSITLDMNNDIVVTGQTFTADGNSNSVTVKYGNSSTSISNNAIHVKDFSLYQNYPNPFNPVTVIRYSLNENHHTTLKIYDDLGREIASLVNGKQNTGSYSVEWDASGYPSGIYYYRLRTENYFETKSMILIK